jgi:hypothetical protein
MAAKNRPDPGTTPRTELAGSFAAEAFKACLYGRADQRQQRSVASALILANGVKGELYEALQVMKHAAIYLSACMATKSPAVHERAEAMFRDALTAANAALAKASGHPEPADAAAQPRTPESGSSSPGDTK